MRTLIVGSLKVTIDARGGGRYLPKNRGGGNGSGEGSRGGHVIGHTGSGKPIYADAKHSTHAEFAAIDHDHAYKLQSGLAKNKINEAIHKMNQGEEYLPVLADAKRHFKESEHHAVEWLVKSSNNPDKIRGEIGEDEK